MTLQVHLPLRELEAAKAELHAVSDPDNPRYGHYLSSEEFEARYAPSAEDVSAVRSFLESQGFTITYVPRDRQFVSARATAATVERVFTTHMGQYEVETGLLRRAPIDPAKIPAAIADRVSTVLGFHTSSVRSMLHTGRAQNSAAATTPSCANYFGEYFDTIDPPYGGNYPSVAPLNPCGLSPPRVRRAYGFATPVAGGNDGRGVRIAISDAFRSPTLVSDAQAYAAQFDPAHPLRSSQITLIDAPSGGDPATPVDPGWYGEQVFDVESVHTIAPGAHIVYVGSPTAGNEDAIAALNFIVQDNLASIVSNSYVFDFETAPDSDRALLDPILIQAGLKGIGMYFGSGDWGDNQCGSSCLAGGGFGALGVLYPAASPYVTAVGGTSLYLNSDGSRAYETGWESGESLPIPNASGFVHWIPPPPGLLINGAGGGPSQIYSQPKYQQHVVPVAVAGSPPARVLPDVAMLADFDSGVMLGVSNYPTIGTPYTVYENAGGTSLATPLFAAAVALAEQRAGHRIGFGNPKFYKVSNVAFSDIMPTPTPQSVASPGAWQDTEDPPGLMVQRSDGSIVPHTLHSARGFDNVTGLGVPKGEEFLEAVSE